MFSRETQALMEAAIDAVIVIDHRGRILAVNDSTRRIFGFRTDQLLGQNVSMLMPEPDRGAHDEYMARYLSTGAARIIGLGREVFAQRSDGTVFPARLSVGRIPDSNPPRFVGLVRDNTTEHEATTALKLERDRANAYLLAQDRLTRVARMATMGVMATGIAHELNQPLTAITTYARACEHYANMPVPDLAELREAVREIGAEGQRAARIITRLRQLVRNDEHVEFAPTDVNVLIEELMILLNADARVHDTRLTVNLTPHLPRVNGSPIQLQQLVLSLARNAFEALAEMPPGERELELRTVRNDGDVEIRVSDNGPGISPLIAGRLFDTFSTTRKSGTGLGLAISRTIAQTHGGTIASEPVLPHGASFRLRLPATEETDQ